MNTKKTIRKILFIGMWLAICSGMLTLFIAAMDKQKSELCKGYSIAIHSERQADYFLDEDAILKLLKASVKGNIKGQSKAVFNLQQMEQMLENNVWIDDAQLYFDNKAVLHVSVKEREPVARIFTAGGKSFYIDSSRKILPLSEKALVKIPVFTGFPDKKHYTGLDSLLLQHINIIAGYVRSHSFWSSQVAQIDIVTDCGAGCWEFEMVPVVGRHIVRLGTAENIEQKFHRLFAFYQQVLNKTGFDYYKTIDVRFAGQVIGAKSDTPKIDSIKYMKYVQELMNQSQDTLVANLAQNITPLRSTPSQSNTSRIETSSNPVPHETSSRQQAPVQRRPRAVMPARR